MNIVFFIIRIIIGLILMIAACRALIDKELKEQNQHLSAGLSVALIGLCILVPVLQVIFTSKRLYPASSFFHRLTGPRVFATIRSFFAFMIGLIGVGVLMGGEYVAGAAIVLFSSIFLIPQLDLLIFGYDEPIEPGISMFSNWHRSFGRIVMLRNVGFFLFLFGTAMFGASDYIIGILTMVVSLILLFARPLVLHFKLFELAPMYPPHPDDANWQAMKEAWKRENRKLVAEAKAKAEAKAARIKAQAEARVKKEVVPVPEVLVPVADEVVVPLAEVPVPSSEDVADEILDAATDAPAAASGEMLANIVNGVLKDKQALITEKPQEPAAERTNLQKLQTEFEELFYLKPHRRGYAFQDFLNNLFSDFDAKSAFRLTGEEIDGSFDIESQTYLMEAKWHSKQCGQRDLLVFNGKVEGKSTWARGIFISYAGFTSEGLIAFARGKRTSIIGMDGHDIELILKGKISLVNAIKRKARRAVETNDFFVSLEELI